ncbi:MAG TPA: hypothetical protein VD927_15505 [Chryseosolibacter sp.]|nr:hypothetical protein [Chryseosolibacter sp.]
MERAHSLISVADFKNLLSELKEKRPDICIRYRVLGEMWAHNFMSILFVSRKGAVLKDEISNRLMSVSDLSNIMQFELDKPFQGFQPYFHYEIQPLLDSKAVLI